MDTVSLFWLFSRYGLAYTAAVVVKHTQWQLYEPLETGDRKGVWFSGWSRGRPTERAAMFLWGNGYLPGEVEVQDKLWLQPAKQRYIAVDWKWVNAEQPIHYDAHGQVCVECHKRKPLTADHWHRDSKGRYGFKTICKQCRCEARRVYYHERVKIAA